MTEQGEGSNMPEVVEGNSNNKSEFEQQIAGALDVVDKVFDNGRPFIEMGYRTDQISIVKKLLDITKKRTPDEVFEEDDNETFPGVGFKDEDSHSEIFVTPTPTHPDTVNIGGIIDTNAYSNFERAGGNPVIKVIKTEEDIDPDGFLRRIITSGKPLGKIGKKLVHTPVRSLFGKDSSTAFWLDPQTKSDICVYFPNDPEQSSVYRKIQGAPEGYQVFGKRQNYGAGDIKRAYDSYSKRSATMQTVGSKV